jgi:hypothetical protein
MESVNLGGRGQRVSDAGVHRRSLRYSNQRARALRRLPLLGERVNVSMRATFILGIPDAFAQFETQLQNAVLKLTGRSSIVVRDYLPQIRFWCGLRKCCRAE